MKEEYWIVSVARKFGGHWLVVRRSDNKIVFSDPSVRTTLRWVDTWGDTIGREKKGRPLVTPIYKQRG